MRVNFGSARTLLVLVAVGACSAWEYRAGGSLIHRRALAIDGDCTTSSTCHVDAVCTDVGNSTHPSHTCVCNRGFFGNGTSCTNSGIWGLKITVQVDVGQCGDEDDVESITQIYSNLVFSGSADVETDESVTAAATADVALTSYDLETDEYEIAITVLFAAQSSADAALASYGALSMGGSVNDLLVSAANAATGETITSVTGPVSAAFTQPETDARPLSGVAQNNDEISLVGTSFLTDCGGNGNGCWVLDVEMPTARAGTYYALYIPKSEGENILPTGGTYEASELASFEVENFPCNPRDVDPLSRASEYTACCLKEFVANYRPVQGFTDWVTTNTALDSCGQGCAPLDSDICSNAPSGDDTDTSLLLGPFTGLNHSYVTRRSGSIVRLYLDEVEFRNMASQITETGETIYYLTTFLGLAQFKCDGSLFLESHAFQLTVDAEKSELFAIATHGTEVNGFLDYINVRASEIDTWSQPVPDAVGEADAETEDLPDITLQWATISFTIASEFTFDAPTLDMTKIRVGKGVFFDEAEWIHACELIWNNPSDKADFERLFDQWCAPSVEFCQTPTSFPDGFVTLHVPLGEGYFTQGSSDDDSSLFVQMEVAARDKFGRPVINVLSASVPLGSSRNRYCEYAGGDAELLEVANADLWVGSVGTQAELDAGLIRQFVNIGTDITSPMEPQPIDSKSIESGLMTLILHGDDDYFNLEVSGTYSLELEDVYTIHIMESGTEMYDKVFDLVRGGKAWRIMIDAVTRQAHLQSTAELQTFCGFSPPPATLFDPLPVTCVSRRDMSNRVPRAANGGANTVLELKEGQEGSDEAAAFFQILLGENDFAAQLGRNFSSLILSNKGINGRYKRAFWINPGYEWAPSLTNGASVFELSSRVIMGALINLNEDGLGQRRRLLTSGADGYFEGIASSNLVYDVDPSSLLANILDLSQEQVTTWNIGMQLTADQACLGLQELRDEMVEIFTDYLDETASPIEKIQIYSVRVDRDEVECPGAEVRRVGKPQLRSNNRKLLVAYSKARGNFETVIAFRGGERAYLDTKKFSEMPGVLSLAHSTVPDQFVFDPDDPVAPGPLATPAPTGPEWKLIGLVCGCVGGLMFLVLAIMLWMRKKHEDEKDERRAEIVWHRSMRHLEMLKDEIKQEILIEQSSMATGEESSSRSGSESESESGTESGSESGSETGSESGESRTESEGSSESEGSYREESPREVVADLAYDDRDEKRSAQRGYYPPGPPVDARSETRSQRSGRSHQSRVSHQSAAARSQRSQRSQEARSEDDTVIEDASRFWLF